MWPPVCIMYLPLAELSLTIKVPCQLDDIEVSAVGVGEALGVGVVATVDWSSWLDTTVEPHPAAKRAIIGTNNNNFFIVVLS